MSIEEKLDRIIELLEGLSMEARGITEASTNHPTQLPQRVRDRHDDYWNLQGDGSYKCEWDPERFYGYSFEDLVSRFGPLVAV
jgi:hypothetical protein